jgi:hypothetical protein
MPTGLLVVTAPVLSVARAVRRWLPDGTFLHVKAYGAVVSWTLLVAALVRKSCRRADDPDAVNRLPRAHLGEGALSRRCLI